MTKFEFVPKSDTEDTLTLDQVADADGVYGSGSDLPAALSLGGVVFDIVDGGIAHETEPADARLFRKLPGTTLLTIES